MKHFNRKYKMMSVSLFMVAVIITFSVSGSVRADSDNGHKQLYTCGMHPEIISEEPGLCPICNMKLTPKKDGSGEAGSVVIDPTTRQNMGLVTQPVKNHHLTRAISARGRLTIPEEGRFSVTVKVSGWVERLFVHEEGERVFKGQPLFEIYSPELVAAQQEYDTAVVLSQNAKGTDYQDQDDSCQYNKK